MKIYLLPFLFAAASVADPVQFNAGTNTVTADIVVGDGREISATGTGVIAATAVNVADTADATSFVAIFESATGNLGPKTDAGLTYDASTGTLVATSFSGPLTGNVTGNISGAAPAGSLTGTTLAANVVTTSITGTGALLNLRAIGTITTGGTTGAQVIDKPTGSVNFAAAAGSLVVTNSLVTTNSIVIPVLQTNDGTAVLGACVPAAGSFTIYMTTPPAAEARVGFVVYNQ